MILVNYFYELSLPVRRVFPQNRCYQLSYSPEATFASHMTLVNRDRKCRSQSLRILSAV